MLVLSSARAIRRPYASAAEEPLRRTESIIVTVAATVGRRADSVRVAAAVA